MNIIIIFFCYKIIKINVDHMCFDPPLFANGQIIFSTDTTSPFDFGTLATYICDTGFSLSGNVARTCTGDDSSPVGIWSGGDPTCISENNIFPYRDRMCRIVCMQVILTNYVHTICLKFQALLVSHYTPSLMAQRCTVPTPSSHLCTVPRPLIAVRTVFS